MQIQTPISFRPSRLAPLLQPLHAFLSAELAGGIVLMACAVAALVWANSPWGDSYQHLWHAKVSVSVAGRVHAMSLEHWVNDGLMVIFFLLVGLEIKRELVIGELASVRRAALPIAAAIGNAAFFTEASSPATSSRLISSPTSRKKMAINPSLIHARRLRLMT